MKKHLPGQNSHCRRNGVSVLAGVAFWKTGVWFVRVGYAWCGISIGGWTVEKVRISICTVCCQGSTRMWFKTTLDSNIRDDLKGVFSPFRSGTEKALTTSKPKPQLCSGKSIAQNTHQTLINPRYQYHRRPERCFSTFQVWNWKSTNNIKTKTPTVQRQIYCPKHSSDSNQPSISIPQTTWKVFFHLSGLDTEKAPPTPKLQATLFQMQPGDWDTPWTQTTLPRPGRWKNTCQVKTVTAAGTGYRFWRELLF